MSNWVYALETHLPWAKLAESYAFLGGVNVTLFEIPLDDGRVPVLDGDPGPPEAPAD